MKSLVLAVALLVLPVAAQAQVAAGSVPNTFDRPAPAAVAPAEMSTPANERAEDTLREIIAGAQAGTMNYDLMTADLAAQVRAQETAIRPLLAGFGPVQAVDFIGSQNGADLFAVTFTTAATQWVIGFDEADKVAALLFRPAE